MFYGPLALLALSTVVQEGYAAIWPFSRKRFQGNSLLSAGSLGLDDDGRVIAFGDFNGDQFLDLLSLSSDTKSLTVYIWDHEAFTFRRSTSIQHSEQILNVIPGDFTYDGTLDLLVMAQGMSAKELNMALYVGVHGAGFDAQSLPVQSSTTAQPIPLDANGDLSIDLLGVAFDTHQLSLWSNVFNRSSPNSPVFDVTRPPFNGQQCSVSHPHSNAVIDLNGDCLADVFLVCDETSLGRKYFQIWTKNPTSGYTLAQLDRFPPGFESVTFADMDRDGTIDMIFTTCSSVTSHGIGQDCSINIAYNKQIPLCTETGPAGSGGSKAPCRTLDKLCSADPDFKFDLRNDPSNDAFVSIPFSSLFPSTDGSSSTPGLLVEDVSSSPLLPLPLKIGDFNLDGYPDILLITASPPKGGFLGIGDKSAQTPALLYSVPCSRGVVGCDSKGKGKRGFVVLKHGVEAMSRITDACNVAFLDLDEDGTLDIMVQRTGVQNEGNVQFIQNNFFFDAFFLKTIVLNGACDDGWCRGTNASEKYQPFGVSYSGASYKYTVIDTTGRRSAAQAGQLPQTSYQALLTPYSFVGLGRTNNYIENLFVGSTKQAEKYFINMEGVIPNSKVVIYPPPAGHDSETWRRELYLRPGELIPLVTLTVIVATVLLAIVVAVLQWNEKREDEMERRRALHHINFDAL